MTGTARVELRVRVVGFDQNQNQNQNQIQMDNLPLDSTSELEDDESFSYAIQLANSVVLPMALQSATQLGVFDVLQKAGPDAKLSADQIASQLSCNNPQAPPMLDRLLSLLASHSVINCSVIQDQHNLGSFQRLYTITPVSRFFARDSDAVSLGPFLDLFHDKVFLASWSVPYFPLLLGGTTNLYKN